MKGKVISTNNQELLLHIWDTGWASLQPKHQGWSTVNAGPNPGRPRMQWSCPEPAIHHSWDEKMWKFLVRASISWGFSIHGHGSKLYTFPFMWSKCPCLPHCSGGKANETEPCLGSIWRPAGRGFLAEVFGPDEVAQNPYMRRTRCLELAGAGCVAGPSSMSRVPVLNQGLGGLLLGGKRFVNRVSDFGRSCRLESRPGYFCLIEG